MTQNKSTESRARWGWNNRLLRSTQMPESKLQTKGHHSDGVNLGLRCNGITQPVEVSTHS